MNNLIGATETICNVHWGYLTIILVFLAFLCYWMVYKKKRELDLVICVATGVFFLIGFIMSFFTACVVCWTFLIFQFIILILLTGYFLYLELKKLPNFFAKIQSIFCKKKEEPAQKPVKPVKKEPAKKPVKEPVKETVKPIEEKPVQKTIEKPVEKTVIKPVEEVAVKPVKKEEPVEEPVEIAATEEEPVGASLKESLSIMDTLVAQSQVTKASICNFLSSTYGDKVVLNNRPNRTKNDRLPMADTHYVLVNGSKVCFVYVYQNHEGGVLLLIKTKKEHYKMIAAKHERVRRSAFPRRGEWYSIVVDDTYTEQEIYGILADVIAINLDNSYLPKK